MAIDTINIGTTANDGSGDPLRTAFTKINTMFTELYGTSGEGVAMKDDETPQLGGDLDVLGRRITSTRSNEDIVILPNGTGGVVASGIRLAGTQLSADDSSAITIAEALQINGATNIDGAVTATSTLTVTGATTVAAISASGAATFTGGVTAGAVTTNAITSNGSNADLSIQPSGTGDVILSALRVNGTTLDSSDSTKVTIAEAVDITGAVTAASTVAITGAATLSSTLAVTGATTLTTTNIDNINIYDNYITSDSNADINITAGGTGNVIVGSLTINGTAISSADSSLIQLNEAVNISGATTIGGAVTLSSSLDFGSAIISNGTVTHAGSSGQQPLDEFVHATYRSAKYIVSITDATNTKYEMVELYITHDGTNAYITSQGVKSTSAGTLAVFAADISGSNVRVLILPSSSESVTYKFLRTLVVV